MASEKPKSFWSVPYVILMAANFFQSMAAFMTNTTIPVYASHLGASAGIIGLVTSSFSISALLIRPFAGPAFDSFSRKRLLILAQAVISISMFMYGMADSVAMLVIVRLFHGAAVGCASPLALSLVSEFLPYERFASGVSVYTLAQTFAQVIGPATGLYLVNIMGFGPSYFLSSALLLVAMLGIFTIKEPKRVCLPYKIELKRIFAPPAIKPAITLMLLSMAFSCVGAYVVLYGYEMGIENMGIYFTVYACCLVATRPFSGRLADRFGARRILVVAISFFAVSFLLMSQARDLAGFLLVAVVASAGFGCAAPLLQSIAMTSVTNEHRGAATNTTFTGLDLGSLVGPLVGGTTIEALVPVVGSTGLAYADMWLVMLVPVVLAFVLSLIWNRKRKELDQGKRGQNEGSDAHGNED